jgi:hypothetical protein
MYQNPKESDQVRRAVWLWELEDAQRNVGVVSSSPEAQVFQLCHLSSLKDTHVTSSDHLVVSG